MKRLVVLSGKGGTGKTTVVAALAQLAGGATGANVVLADADPDAANLTLALGGQVIDEHEFRSGHLAVIDPDLCRVCLDCTTLCAFGAIEVAGAGGPVVAAAACEGCGTCAWFCPERAIDMVARRAGRWLRARTPHGALVYGELAPGGETSGKLVTRVREEAESVAARQHCDLLLLDGPPGIGCPAIAALARADHALLVTEATSAALHDLKRVLELARSFGVPASVCVNRAGLYAPGMAAVERFCRAQGVRILARIPFDPAVPRALLAAVPVTRAHPTAPSSRALRRLWRNLAPLLAAQAA